MNEWIKGGGDLYATWTFTFEVPPTAFLDHEEDERDALKLRFVVTDHHHYAADSPLKNRFGGTFEIVGVGAITIYRITAPTLEEAKAKLAKCAAALVGELAVFVHDSKALTHHTSKNEQTDRRGTHSGGAVLRRCSGCGVYAENQCPELGTHDFVAVDREEAAR